MYCARCSSCQLRHQNKLGGHGKLCIHSLQNGESKEEAIEFKLDAKDCLDQELALILDDDERKQWSGACSESFCPPLIGARFKDWKSHTITVRDTQIGWSEFRKAQSVALDATDSEHLNFLRFLFTCVTRAGPGGVSPCARPRPPKSRGPHG